MKFEPNKPVETTEAIVTVDPPLPAGPHRFQLVVVNARGERSKPTSAVVKVLERAQPPTPIP